MLRDTQADSIRLREAWFFFQDIAYIPAMNCGVLRYEG